MQCEQSAGCAGQDPPFLDVYSSRFTITDHASPAPAVFDGQVRNGRLSGTVRAADDGGGGVRRVDVTALGALKSSSPACDFSRPQPCPSRHELALEANAGLAILRYPLVITTVDASGRSTTNTVLVAVSR